MSTKDSQTLLECPFCGSSDHLNIKREDGRNYRVNCNAKVGGCGASNGWKRTKEDAISDWNTRHKRTCKMVPDGLGADANGYITCECDQCGFEMQYASDAPPTGWCAGCGAEVVDGD